MQYTSAGGPEFIVYPCVVCAFSHASRLTIAGRAPRGADTLTACTRHAARSWRWHPSGLWWRFGRSCTRADTAECTSSQL